MGLRRELFMVKPTPVLKQILGFLVRFGNVYTYCKPVSGSGPSRVYEPFVVHGT